MECETYLDNVDVTTSQELPTSNDVAAAASAKCTALARIYVYNFKPAARHQWFDLERGKRAVIFQRLVSNASGQV
jgi:hypothetical protein